MYDDGNDGDTLDLMGPPLVVHDVGSFDASFVPNVASFERLDERFRLSDSLGSQLPHHQESARWERSIDIADDESPECVAPAEVVLTPEKTKGVIAFGEPARKLAITGLPANQDVLVPLV